jgi:hypothetical protein
MRAECRAEGSRKSTRATLSPRPLAPRPPSSSMVPCWSAWELRVRRSRGAVVGPVTRQGRTATSGTTTDSAIKMQSDPIADARQEREVNYDTCGVFIGGGATRETFDRAADANSHRPSPPRPLGRPLEVARRSRQLAWRLPLSNLRGDRCPLALTTSALFRRRLVSCVRGSSSIS